MRQRSGKSLQAALVALILVVYTLGEWTQGFADLNARASDILLRWHVVDRHAPADILLVDIDQASLDDPEMLDLAGSWPWPRAIHGELVEYLARHQPALIAFDVIFSEPDVFRPGSDAVLSEAVARHHVLLPLVVAADGQGTPLRNLPDIMNARPGPQANPNAELPLIAPKAIDPNGWRTGLINFLADDDRVGRRYWVHYPHDGWTLPSLPARIGEQLGWTLPADASIRLNWYGRGFERVSYRDLLLAAQTRSGKPPVDLAGKIILIGAAAPGLHDLRPTPLGATTPGPEILATAVGNLRDGDWLRPVSPAWNIGLGWCGLLAVFLLFRRRADPLPIAIGLLIGSSGIIAIAFALLKFHWQWAPFSALLAIWLGYAGSAAAAYLRERSQRDHAVQMFSRFLDPNVVRQLTDGGQLAKAETGTGREITVLFSDIRGFTSLSEHRSPEEIVTLLNRYFDLEVAAIFEQGGTLDKFIGDAIMAFWNAPVAMEDHAVRAVRAALGMCKALEVFRQELGDEVADFDIGIGLHTGPAVVGFLGASQRLDYTAIGDTVNLASRIEGQTKGIARVLVSEATRRACGNVFEFVDHGEFTVKGRTQAVRLFEPRERS